MPLANYVGSDGNVTLHHYTSRDLGDSFTVDPAEFGRNRHSKAEVKASSYPRTFFYVSPADKEHLFNGSNHYTRSHDASKIYDVHEDRDGIIANMTGGFSPSAMLRDVEKAGYDGVYYEGSFPTVSLLKPFEVSKVKEHTPARLARHQDLQKHSDFWGLIHAVAESENHGSRDETAKLALADKIGDITGNSDDPRAATIRESLPFNSYNTDGQSYGHRHPLGEVLGSALSRRVEDPDTGTHWESLPPARTYSLGSQWPHTHLSMYHGAIIPSGDGHRARRVPIVQYRIRLPKTKAPDGRARNTVFMRAFADAQGNADHNALHDFINTLPKKAAAHWAASARAAGWSRTDGKPHANDTEIKLYNRVRKSLEKNAPKKLAAPKPPPIPESHRYPTGAKVVQWKPGIQPPGRLPISYSQKMVNWAWKLAGDKKHLNQFADRFNYIGRDQDARRDLAKHFLKALKQYHTGNGGTYKINHPDQIQDAATNTVDMKPLTIRVGQKPAATLPKPPTKPTKKPVAPVRFARDGKSKPLTPKDAAYTNGGVKGGTAEGTTEHDALLNSAQRGLSLRDPYPLAVFADHLDENGRVGGVLAREGAAHTNANKVAHLGQEPFTDTRPQMVRVDGEASRLLALPVPTSSYGPGMHINHYGDNVAPFTTGGDGFLNYSVPVRSRHHLATLMKDWTPEARASMWRQLAPHLPSKHEDDGKPLKLARMPYRQDDEGSAMASAGSKNHEARLSVVRQILKDSGLTPATVRAAIAHDGSASRPSFSTVVPNGGHPDHLRYTAAWLGLMTGEKRMAVVQPDDDGEDFLHVISAPGAPDHVAQALKAAGVPRFTSERTATGSRTFVLNPLGKYPVEKLIRGIPNAKHSTSRVRVYRVGAGSSSDANGGQSSSPAANGAAARASYRTVIDDFERAAGAGGSDATA